MVVYICNSSTWKAEAKESEVQGHQKLSVILHYIASQGKISLQETSLSAPSHAHTKSNNNKRNIQMLLQDNNYKPLLGAKVLFAWVPGKCPTIKAAYCSPKSPLKYSV